MGIDDLKLRLRALIAPRRVERDLHDELAFHIEREAAKLIEQGMPPDAARARAQARFGSPATVADECRDERGTAFIDNTIGDVQFALRSFRRSPLAAFTIITTVAIGLGIVAALYTILNTMIFRRDAVPDVHEMYSVERVNPASGQSLFTRPDFEAMRRETPVFAGAYATIAEIDLRVDGRMMAASLVTSNFHEVLGVRPAMGRGLVTADDDNGGSPVIVLSHKGWDRHFKRDPNVLGRTVRVNGAPFEIIGVTAEGFRGLEFSGPDLWAPLPQLAQFVPDNRGREDSVAVQIVGRLAPGMSMERARAQIAAWDAARQPPSADRRPEPIDLLPRWGSIPQPLEAVAMFTPLFFAFGLILLIGCANVANLLLARGVARQREIGLRLSLGASRPRIIRQLLTESVILALAAAAVGYFLSRATLETVVYFAMQSMPVDLGDVNIGVPAADWRVAVFLVLAAIAATGFFALVPALQSTRVDPVRTLRGELVAGARPARYRNSLIGIQVFASALLLICAAIFLRSSIASARFDPGLRTADTVAIEIINEPKREAMIRAIAAESTVVTYAAVRPGMLAPPPGGFAVIGDVKKPISYKYVSPEYFDVFAVPIVRGRTFTAAEREGEHPVVIVSESTARELWPNGGGIGETFRIEPQNLPPSNALLTADITLRHDPAMPAKLVTVIGISRDVRGFRITDIKNPGIFMPIGATAAKTSLVARITGDPTLARQTLLEQLTMIDPAMGNIVTMKTVARLETFFLEIAFWITMVLGGLALLLTVSGLFSVLSYLVEQRTREIGVRMALGASANKVAQLILTQTARPVLYGLMAGVGLAAALAAVLIATPVGALIGAVVHVTDPIAYAASLLLIVAACASAAWIPATRAARLDPMRTLRQE